MAVEGAAVAAVSVKLPPFWPADPQVWFAQVEAQFATRGITVQKTKFDYVIASLAPEFATEVRDLILAPPEETPYDTLKQQLVKRTMASEQRRLQLLLNAEDLGDRKPTQLLRRMQQLLGEKAGAMDKSLFRELFLQRLPSNVRMVLASSPDSVGLEDLAQLADRITEVSASTPPSVSALTPSRSSESAEVDQLRSEVASLKQLVKSLARPPPRRRSRTPTPPPASSPGFCWYHRRFGRDAKKCSTPCSWPGNGQASR